MFFSLDAVLDRSFRGDGGPSLKRIEGQIVTILTFSLSRCAAVTANPDEADSGLSTRRVPYPRSDARTSHLVVGQRGKSSRFGWVSPKWVKIGGFRAPTDESAAED